MLTKDIGLSAGEELKYDIRFKNDEIENYTSRHMEISCRLEAFILVDKMNKFNNFISEDLRVEFVGKNRKLSVVPKTIQLEMEEILVLLGLLILVPLFIYLSPVVNLVLYLLATLGFSIILVTLNYFFRIKYLGDVFAFFQNKEGNHFLLTLKNSRRWRHLKKLSVYYEIFESYRTSSGGEDGNNRVRHTIFKSEKKSISNPLNQVQIEFEFPQEMPATTMLHPDGIYWKIVVEAESDVGKNFIYKNTFEVKKVDS